MTQADLAGPEFTDGFVSLVETARTRVSLRAAEILAGRLGISVSELLEPGARQRSQLELELSLLRAEAALACGRPRDAADAAARGERSAVGPLRGRFLRMRGRALVELGQAREAVPVLEAALDELRRAGQRDLAARALYDLALAHARLDEPPEALVLALECERALRAGGVVDRTLELQVRTFLAAIYVRSGDHQKADLQTERAIILAQDVADRGALASLYGSLAQVREQQHDLEAALVYAQRAVELQHGLARERVLADAWQNLGWIYMQRRQFARAERALRSAETIAQESGESRVLGWIAATRAELALARDKPAEAAALADAAASARGAPAGLRGEALLTKAQALERSHARVDRVREVYASAIEALRGEPPRVRAKAHERFSGALERLGRPQEALREARTAARLALHGD